MRPLLIIVLLIFPALAAADEISGLEQQRALLDGHRARLETLLGEQSKRISRLKAQPAGIQRDYQLGAALRENQALANRLTRLRSQLREATQKLLEAHDKALQQPNLSAVTAARLQRRRAELASLLASSSTRIALGEKASALDAPEDLDEKADLLQDSEEKVRRQLRQLQGKLSRLEHRARLERHAKAVDDNPFVEDSPRRSGAARKVATAATAGENSRGAMDPSPGSPASPAPPPDGKQNSPSPASYADSEATAGLPPPAAAPGGGGPVISPDTRSSETIISIRDVLDPALLRDSPGSDSGDGLRARIIALKKASERLRQVAGQLSSQAGELRRRARSLRKQP